LSYKIREVDGEDELEELRSLHDECFGGEAPQITDNDVINGHWWLVWEKEWHIFAPAPHWGSHPIAFAGLKQSLRFDNVGYLYRVGVMPAYRGQGLQKRLITVREAKAKRLGYIALVTDTTDNPASANSLINCGFHIHEPYVVWGPNPRTIYWRKWLVPRRRKQQDTTCVEGLEVPLRPLQVTK
jgi:GNAT superfamily N-acetyltransferase